MTHALCSLCRSCRRRFPVSARILPRRRPWPITPFCGPPWLRPRLRFCIGAFRPTTPRLLRSPGVRRWHTGHHWRCCPSRCLYGRLLPGSRRDCIPSRLHSRLARTAMQCTLIQPRSAHVWMSGLLQRSLCHRVCPRNRTLHPRTPR